MIAKTIPIAPRFEMITPKKELITLNLHGIQEAACFENFTPTEKQGICKCSQVNQ